jgi:hypothetical protein
MRVGFIALMSDKQDDKTSFQLSAISGSPIPDLFRRASPKPRPLKEITTVATFLFGTLYSLQLIVESA